MYRRDLLKALIATPLMSGFATSAANLKSGKRAATPITKLRVAFIGPFAVFCDANQPKTVQTFTPMEKNKHHAFFINGQRQKQKQLHAITFVADDGALQPNATLPHIDSCFDPFNWHDSLVPVGSRLIETIMPSPDAIYCTAFTTPIHFESGTPANMPSGHIFEYTVLDFNKTIKMTDPVMGDQLPQIDDAVPGIAFFILQVGLRKHSPSDDPDPDGTHAVHFHNDQLLANFPHLQNDPTKRLATVGSLQGAQVRNQFPNQLRRFTTAVECKSGGFIVTNQ